MKRARIAGTRPARSAVALLDETGQLVATTSELRWDASGAIRRGVDLHG